MWPTSQTNRIRAWVQIMYSLVCIGLVKPQTHFHLLRPGFSGCIQKLEVLQHPHLCFPGARNGEVPTLNQPWFRIYLGSPTQLFLGVKILKQFFHRGIEPLQEREVADRLLSLRWHFVSLRRALSALAFRPGALQGRSRCTSRFRIYILRSPNYRV